MTTEKPGIDRPYTADEFAALPWLHIYAQYMSHAPARIWGTRAALQNIRDAIDRCLSSGMETEAEAICSGGEGYGVEIRIRSLEALENAEPPSEAWLGRNNPP